MDGEGGDFCFGMDVSRSDLAGPDQALVWMCACGVASELSFIRLFVLNESRTRRTTTRGTVGDPRRVWGGAF